MTYPKKNGDPDKLKVKTRDDQSKVLQFETELHDPENFFKSLKKDNDCYKKKYKSLNKKKVKLNITEILEGSASTITSATLSTINPSIGVVISTRTALLTSVAIFVTNEYNSKLKIRYTQLGNWIIVFTLLF